MPSDDSPRQTHEALAERSPEGYEDRPGRSGPDTGNETGGQGAEFAMDATTGAPEDDVADADAGDSYLRAHGSSPESR